MNCNPASFFSIKLEGKSFIAPNEMARKTIGTKSSYGLSTSLTLLKRFNEGSLLQLQLLRLFLDVIGGSQSQ